MRIERAFMHPARRLLARMNPKADLIRATEQGQLDLVYQPVVDLDGGEIQGWEALVRWQHPDRGLVSPAEFIPRAKDTGAILAVGKWVLDRACEDFANALGRDGQPGRWVSVNISSQELLELDFADSVRESLQRWGLEPGSLVLEITEAAVIGDLARAAGALASLQRDGVRIALDDFGTASSSLHYLQELPVDIIKIDRSLISISGAGPLRMLEAIVALGNALGVEMIAEGIEDSAELERVKRFERVSGQGYYLARPMSLADARTFTFTFTPLPS